jgi:nucleoporin GLE1
MAEVGANEQKAFALANMIVGLLKNHPRFLIYFKSRVVKKCPYSVPYLPRKGTDQNVDDYKKRLGYKHGEAEEHFQERMCGVMCLYGAVIQTQSSKISA